MNLITDTWRGLVQRKLWPVALLLLAALVAVPFTLAKQPEVEPVPANAVANADEGLPATYVTAAGADEEADEDGAEKRRRTLGAPKDPFEPAPLPKAKKKQSAKKPAKSASKKTESTSTKSDSKSSGSTGGGDGGASTPTAPSVTPTPTATPTPPPANSIRVRFTRVQETGGSGETEEAPAATVQRLEVLPDEENPVLAYHGLKDGGKVAVFELSGNVTVEGDGTCEPTPENCQYLELRAGETAFVTVADTGEDTDAQYQLDLLKINGKGKAKASSAKLEKADEAEVRTFAVRR